MRRNIVVIAAHPDDEALGCGGFLLKEKKKGSAIHFLFMTDGISARSLLSDADILSRQKGFLEAMEFVHPSSFKCLSFPDNQMDTVPFLSIVREIELFLDEKKPDVVLTHYLHDLNIDHSLTFKAVMTASRPGTSYSVNEIYSFEVPSSSEWVLSKKHVFAPDTYVNISLEIDEKIKYLKSYDTEMRAAPHPRSYENVRALNQMRGSHVNVGFAEAFLTVRRILND